MPRPTIPDRSPTPTATTREPAAGGAAATAGTAPSGPGAAGPWWCDVVAARVLTLLVATVAVLIGPCGPWTWLALGVVAGWVAVTGVVAWRGSAGHGMRHAVGTPVALVDVLLLVAGVATTGGTESDVRWLLLAVPAIWAGVAARRFALLVGVAAAGYAAVAATDLGGEDAVGTAARFLVLLAGAAVLARLMAKANARAEAMRLALTRQRAEHAEELAARERLHHERLTSRLHDGPLQLVSSVFQDIEEHRAGEPVDFAQVSDTLQRSIAAMRDMTRDLYASVLDDAGLAAALGHAAAQVQQQGGPPVTVEVGVASSGPHDGLLVAATHELLTNVRKHAKATHASVVVSRGADGTIVLAVRDDGVGMTPQDRAAAVAGGHIGLDATGRRVAGVGGRVRYDDDEPGTTVVVLVPEAPDAPAVPA
jgi:two-component system NarL family sensor kinase